jgi:iron complex outermembrane recepter protein
MYRTLLGSLLAATAIVAPATEARAQRLDEREYTLPAQDLSRSLRDVSAQSGRGVLAPSSLVARRQAPALNGRYTAEEAVRILLAGSGLTVRTVGDSLVIVAEGGGESPVETASADDPVPESASIVVTGTRLRGAPVPAPVIRLDREQILEEGRATLAEAVRTIPQNFGGGQNPGVGNNVPQSSGVNVGSATSVNLRGLGSDATLTLLNGHRLSYSASRQAIDISAIPLGAVERIEILPDGASALYGSDAVAGVVNIILRRDYEGFETSARLGASTDGGAFEQRYGAVAGTTWSSGGVIAAYEFGRTTEIEGRARSYAADRPALILYPFLRGHSATISAHQQLSPNLRLEVDGLYNNRFSASAYASNAAGDISLSGTRFAYRSEAFVIAPTLELDPGGGWRLFLTGSYGEDRTHYDVTNIFNRTVFRVPDNCYCNSVRAAELGGDGPLFELPGGPVRLAAGFGYRENRLVRFNGVGADTNVTATQDSRYIYGELSVPIVSPAQNLALVDRLSLSAALRYEDYPDAGSVVTPKLGLVYAPSPDVALRGSWGRSFRAPTLQQQFGARLAILIPPAFIGGSGLPAGATALVIDGGNPDLSPERASSWSATLDVHPRALPGARVELSYFRTRYRDRVVTPILFLSQALSNPLYRDRLTFNPSAALLAQTVAGAVSFTNATGAPYDPAAVAVLVDNGNVNAARQSIEGADLLLSYRTTIGRSGDHLTLRLNATYLDSEQQLSAGQPVLPLAGIIYNPPHVRARAGISWEHGPFTATGNLTYIGGVDDARRAATVRVESMTTADLTLRYRSGAASGPFSGIDLSLSVQNLFDEQPGRIATTLFSDAPFDSTNYSPLGRFVAFSITKRW